MPRKEKRGEERRGRRMDVEESFAAPQGWFVMNLVGRVCSNWMETAVEQEVLVLMGKLLRKCAVKSNHHDASPPQRQTRCIPEKRLPNSIQGGFQTAASQETIAAMTSLVFNDYSYACTCAFIHERFILAIYSKEAIILHGNALLKISKSKVACAYHNNNSMILTGQYNATRTHIFTISEGGRRRVFALGAALIFRNCAIRLHRTNKYLAYSSIECTMQCYDRLTK